MLLCLLSQDDNLESLSSQLFALGVMQLLLLERNAAGRMPYVLHSLITLFSLWFWRCLRFPTTCWFCCTSTSHCFCNAFKAKPKSCRQSRKSCAVINMVRADMRHQYQPPYHSYKHALCNILSMAWSTTRATAPNPSIPAFNFASICALLALASCDAKEKTELARGKGLTMA